MHLQKLGDDCGTRNLDEDDMVETNTVEQVEQSKTTLNFVRFDNIGFRVSSSYTITRKIDGASTLALDEHCDGQQ